MIAEWTESVVATIQSAARKLTGFRRRQFQAEMAAKYWWRAICASQA